jgi:hypothetical protein
MFAKTWRWLDGTDVGNLEGVEQLEDLGVNGKVMLE